MRLFHLNTSGLSLSLKKKSPPLPWLLQRGRLNDDGDVSVACPSLKRKEVTHTERKDSKLFIIFLTVSIIDRSSCLVLVSCLYPHFRSTLSSSPLHTPQSLFRKDQNFPCRIWKFQIYAVSLKKNYLFWQQKKN